MKTIKYLAAGLLLSSLGTNAQDYSENFDAHNNRNALWSNCWQFFGTDVKSNNAISGSSTRSGQATSLTNKKEVLTPFLDIKAGSKISFTHKISSYRNQDDRFLDIVLVDVNGVESAPIFQHTYTSGSVQTESNITVGSTGVYRVAFQHYGTGGQGRGHLDDIVVTNATYASDPSDGCKPIIAVTDADGDGVSDDQDAFPNDVTRAYRVFTNAGGYGSVAFEDLWPAQGDYDFNDMVTDYLVEFVMNAANDVVEMKVKVYVRAVGAGVINGLGLEFPSIATGKATSVTGASITDNYITIAANGAEANQTNLVVIPFDNVESVINRNGGQFYNTTRGQAEAISDTIRMTISLSAGVSLSSALNLNPFVIKDRVRGQEIHLADRTPTDLADITLFGTGDDDSNPGAGRFYKTANNFPWAIATPIKFDYPAEKNDIVTVHNNFASWAQSSGSTFANWYADQPGYRTLVNLFN